MLKKHELYDRTEKPVVCRDTRHEHHGPVVFNSSNTRQLGLRLSGYGAAEVFINFTEELRHAETNPTCKIHESYCTSRIKFDTKILRSDIFAQVNLMSVAPTLQNLRIGLKRRQSGKSKVPAKQRGSWPKEC